MFLERLNHSDQPPEAQSPLVASAMAALVSFVLVYWLDRPVVSLLRLWWAELLAFAVIPILLAFVVLYRSSWHQDMRRAVRAVLVAAMSCTIFGVVVIIAAMAMVVISFVYFGYIDRFGSGHY